MSESRDDAASIMLYSVVDTVRRKWKVFVLIAIASFGVGYAATYLMRPIYRAEAILLPLDNSNELRSFTAAFAGLGDLASIMGITPRQASAAEGLATLRSAGFVRRFLKKHGLIATVNDTSKWQIALWRRGDGNSVSGMDRAVRRFHQRVLNISEDHRTGIVKLQVYWYDPEAAADWANELVAQVNAELRQQTLDESTRRLRYLRAKAEENVLTSVREAVFSVIESEIKSAMIASARIDFAFRILDRAYAPAYDDYVAPNRLAIGAITSLFGLVLAILFARIVAKD